MRREKNIINKDTRWDRIRKRHANGSSLALKTDVVRRFIEMDFIGKYNESILNGEPDAKLQLNPQLVMDLRHEMFRNIRNKLPLATVANNERNLKSCVAHNIAVEEHYINNELSKFRNHLEKNHKRNKIKRKTESEITLKLNNEVLMQSLESASNHINDFYRTPIEALEAVEEIFAINSREIKEEILPRAEANRDYKSCAVNEKPNRFKEITSVEEEQLQVNKEINESPKEKRTDCENAETSEQVFITGKVEEEEREIEIGIELRSEELIPQYSPDWQEDLYRQPSLEELCHQHEQHLHMRCVRFEEDVEIRKYKRENSSCSNTSDGIDSVISDLAEEALMELQMEEQNRANNDNGITQVVAEKGDEEERTEITTLPENFQTENLLIISRMQLPDLICDARRTGKDDVEDCSMSDENDETESNHEQNLIIEKLFQSRAHTNIDILRKYFLKWIHFTTIEKIERENCSSKHDRIHKINVFLDKIRKVKKRLAKTNRAETHEGVAGEKDEQNQRIKLKEGFHPISKKYQNKIKIQQDIIDLQRVKLERQQRLIMELKLHKLSEEAQLARQELKDELKNVIRSGDPKVKAKAKCLQLIGNLRDAEDEEFARLQGKALLMPKFLQNMQERALERSIKHEQARQRRLQQDAEREAQKIAAEEAKRLEDEEAKRVRIEALKEKRRQERMAKILKERERQRAIENNRKSQEFCRRLLLRRIGMEGFKRLLERKRENQQKCEALRRNICKRIYFVGWRDYCVLMRERKIVRADNFYHKILMRDTINVWRLYVQDERSKYNVAVDWYEMKLNEMVFARWFGYTKRMLMIVEAKMRQAASHHEWNLKFKVLDCWQRLPQILQLEKETEERRQRWRMKIWELLPDYKPNRDDDFFP